MEISKEQLSEIRFPNSDVLTAQKQEERMQLLKNAMLAGNLYKTKSTLEFQTQQGIRFVTTTIWHCTDKHVVLKGGRIIPVHAITAVR
ncbi:MAG: hypothetical protein ACRC3B_17995 [Bacteroidia bacterium]